MLLLALSLLPVSLCAQEAPPAAPRHEFSVWTAQSFGNGHAFSHGQDRTLSLLGFRYGRAVGRVRDFSFRYVVEARPVAVLGDLRQGPAGAQRAYVYGGGFSPIGMEMTYAARRRVHPFMASSEGFLYFNQRVLSVRESQFQFTAYVAWGAEIMLSRRKAVQFGYMYHHFSNANLYGDNIALDAHAVFVGYSWYR